MNNPPSRTAQSLTRGLASLLHQVRRLIQSAQMGARRAAYGRGTIKRLAERLTVEFGRGFSECMRKFYILWKDRAQQIPQKPSAEFPPDDPQWRLSWSHYVLLLTLSDENPPEGFWQRSLTGVTR